MNHSASLVKLAPALLAAQREMPSIVKDRINPHFKNAYATLDGILNAVRPVLAKHGFVILQGAEKIDGGLAVSTRLLHESSEWIETVAAMPLDKATPQGAGSALTYGRRYGLSAVLALSVDEDDDGNAASKAAKPAAKAPERPAAPAKPAKAPPAARRTEIPGVMPFGKSKGLPLATLDSEKLRGALDWATAANRYPEFQKGAAEELALRGERDVDESMMQDAP